MRRGFTLIELLIVISIIGILAGITLIALSGARAGARDTKRKGDLEQIRAGVQLYYADCQDYPSPLSNQVPSPLRGDGSPAVCATGNTYIEQVPTDPTLGLIYRYARPTATTYELCAALEQGSGSQSCGSSSNCGTATCNYKVTNP